MSEGRDAKVAFKKASAWGTAVACGANDGVLVTSVSLTRRYEQLVDEAVGQAFKKNQDTGKQTVDGSLDAELRYDGFDTLLAIVMGAAGTPSQANGDAYTNDLTLADKVDGLFGSLAVYKGYSVHEHPAAKIAGMTIEGEAGGTVRVTFNLIGDTIAVNTSSGTNNTTTIGNVTYTESANRILFRHGKFMLNDATDSALATSDMVYPGRFRLDYQRPLTPNWVANADNSDETAEPTGDGFPNVSLTLEFPEYGSGGDAYISDLGNGTHKKMQISFEGEAIETSYNRELSIYLPNLVIANADVAVDGAGKITQPLELVALGTVTERSGMTGLYNPFKIKVQNQRSTDPLA